MKRILVANRGEIARRVMRTARRMGIETVAIYSEADALAPHVRFADHAVCVGPAPSSQSYLNQDAVLKAALDTQADAIHPGYGFLSENAGFCRRVKEAGIVFIGPSPEAMELMGSKTAAKNAVKQFEVPLVPGIDRGVRDAAEAQQIADGIGYPVLLKAAAGGGGKGMRLVHRSQDLPAELAQAQSEARNAFGDDSVFVEKYVTKPRHIEIQVLADSHGNTLYLFERECSIQRRHQKVVEEAPSSVLTPELRRQMGEAAVNVCRSCSYTNAGTVEFLLDGEGKFYFLEMNTRLQVEHPVTEMITGLDLVEWQIRIARGEKLSFTQDDLRINGHALEIRVYAEDPANNFLPDIGKLLVYRPATGEGIRVDDGVYQGQDIPIYYDPMLAKLIVHAPDRELAIACMRQAIDSFEVVGIETTLGFCRFVMDHPAFQSGDFDTSFVGKYFTPESLQRPLTVEEAEVLALVAPVAIQRQEGSALQRVG